MPQLLRQSNGSITMVEHYRSYDPDIDGYDENSSDHPVTPYRFGQSARRNSPPEESVPLFLSDYDGEPDPSEYMPPLRRRRASISLRLLAGVSAAAAVAVLFALFSSDSTRDIIVNAKASLAAVLPASSAAAQPDPTQLTARDVQLKDPARLSAPANQTPGVRNVTVAAVAPTRDEIAAALKAAHQSQPESPPSVAAAPSAATAPPAAAAPPVRQLDADELAALLKRARGFIAIGDISSARLLLERAADAQEASAALLLAQTYDPAVLGAQDMRSITPDPAMARSWYEKAARFGSTDAQQRLAQMQN
jgi:TPR repeat protein